MAQDNEVVNIFDEMQNFTTFKNQNNFDDYFAFVLPTLSI
jgi:hypothetical protein